MDINERIRIVMETHRLTPGAFAEKIGVQRSNVSHILSGRNRPGFEFIEKILLAFPRVQADWLITGRHGAVKEVADSEEGPVYNAKTPEAKPGPQRSAGKKVVKIVTFYSDFTFDTYTPNAE